MQHPPCWTGRQDMLDSHLGSRVIEGSQSRQLFFAYWSVFYHCIRVAKQLYCNAPWTDMNLREWVISCWFWRKVTLSPVNKSGQGTSTAPTMLILHSPFCFWIASTRTAGNCTSTTLLAVNDFLSFFQNHRRHLCVKERKDTQLPQKKKVQWMLRTSYTFGCILGTHEDVGEHQRRTFYATKLHPDTIHLITAPFPPSTFTPSACHHKIFLPPTA